MLQVESNKFFSIKPMNITISTIFSILVLIFLLFRILENTNFFSKKDLCLYFLNFIKLSLLISIIIITILNLNGLQIQLYNINTNNNNTSSNTNNNNSNNNNNQSQYSSFANSLETIFNLQISNTVLAAQNNLNNIISFINSVQQVTILQQDVNNLVQTDQQNQSIIYQFFVGWSSVFQGGQDSLTIIPALAQLSGYLITLGKQPYETINSFIANNTTINQSYNEIIQSVNALEKTGTTINNLQILLNALTTCFLINTNIPNVLEGWATGTLLQSILNVFNMTNDNLVSYLEQWISDLQPYNINSLSLLQTYLTNQTNYRNWLWNTLNIQSLMGNTINTFQDLVNYLTTFFNNYNNYLSVVSDLNSFLNHLNYFSNIYIANEVLETLQLNNSTDFNNFVSNLNNCFNGQQFSGIIALANNLNTVLNYISSWNLSPSETNINTYNSQAGTSNNNSYNAMVTNLPLTPSLLSQVYSWICNDYLQAVNLFTNNNTIQTISSTVNNLVSNQSSFYNTFNTNDINGIITNMQTIYGTFTSSDITQSITNYSNFINKNPSFICSFTQSNLFITPTNFLNFLGKIQKGANSMGITSTATITTTNFIDLVNKYLKIKNMMVTSFSIDSNSFYSNAQYNNSTNNGNLLFGNISNFCNWVWQPGVPFNNTYENLVSVNLANSLEQLNLFNFISTLQSSDLDQLNAFYNWIQLFAGIIECVSRTGSNLTIQTFWQNYYNTNWQTLVQNNTYNNNLLAAYVSTAPNQNYNLFISTNYIENPVMNDVINLTTYGESFKPIINDIVQNLNLPTKYNCLNQFINLTSWQIWYYGGQSLNGNSTIINNLFTNMTSTLYNLYNDTNNIPPQTGYTNSNLDFQFLNNINLLPELFCLSIFYTTMLRMAASNNVQNVNANNPLYTLFLNYFYDGTNTQNSLSSFSTPQFELIFNNNYQIINNTNNTFNTNMLSICNIFNGNYLANAIMQDATFNLDLFHWLFNIWGNNINLYFLSSTNQNILQNIINNPTYNF